MGSDQVRSGVLQDDKETSMLTLGKLGLEYSHIVRDECNGGNKSSFVS